MHDHAIICKFMGLWPSKIALTGWIKHRWSSKGQCDIKLRSKGFFTVIFNLLDDYITTFKGGPYFFNVVGLYMRPYKENFSVEKEDFKESPIWIKLYSLSREY